MKNLKITSQDFEKEVLQNEKEVLIDFYADWCGPCKMLAPIIEEIAKENEKVKVVKINVDESEDLAMKYQVMSIPTLIIMKKGKIIKRTVGLVEKDEILNMINK